MTVVYYAVEGDTDVPVAEHLIRLIGLYPRPNLTHGFLLSIGPVVALNWLILRDLDRDAPCASALIADLLHERGLAPRVSLRIPVRAMESWLLADREGFTGEFGVAAHRLPDRPDELDDPKQHLVHACRHSTRRTVRNAMVPRPGSGRRVGPEYASRIAAFARATWSAERASRRSPSLERALAGLRDLVASGIW